MTLGLAEIKALPGLEITTEVPEIEKMRRSLEELRTFCAGPCGDPTDPRYPNCPFPGEQAEPRHRHYTDHYEKNRSLVIALNYILEGEYAYTAGLVEAQARYGVEE